MMVVLAGFNARPKSWYPNDSTIFERSKTDFLTTIKKCRL